MRSFHCFLLWLFESTAAMMLDMSKVQQHSLINLTVIQQNQAGTYTLELDKRDTFMRLYSLLAKLSGFDEADFSLYLGDQVLPKSPSPISSFPMQKQEFLEMEILPRLSSEDTDGPLRKSVSPNATMRRSVSPEAVMFSPRMRDSPPQIELPKRAGKSPRMTPQHIRTPRKRVRNSKVGCFHRLPIEMQIQVKEAFYHDIIHSQSLTISLENKYPELIQAMFFETPKFFQLLTPEMMIEIDEIEEALKDSDRYFDVEDSIELEVGPIGDVSAMDVLHVTARINGVEMPLIFDCLSMDTTMSFGAYLAAFPDSIGLPQNGQLNIDMEFSDTPGALVGGVQVALEHDTEPWIKAGLEFMHDHRVSINFGTDDVNINGLSIPFS